MGFGPDMGETVLSYLPIHPITGLQALGFTSRGPIWPVMGGSQPAGDPQQTPPAPPAPATPGPGPAGPQPPSGPTPPTNTDKGFPDGTPLDQMTVEQREAYWKHYARKHEGDAKAFAQLGLTPEQIQALQTRNDELETAQLSASDKAIKDAQKAAKAEAESEWKPKYLTSELKACAAEFIKGDKLQAFMAAANPAAFVNDAGEIDAGKVTTHLTTLFGPQSNGQGNSHREWGQHGGPSPTTKPGEGGRAEAKRRQGATT